MTQQWDSGVYDDDYDADDASEQECIMIANRLFLENAAELAKHVEPDWGERSLQLFCEELLDE